MKRLLFLLLALPLLMTSCKDDDDMPNVDFNVDITGGVNVGGVIYVVKGDTLKINSVEIVSHDDKNAAIGAVSYFWDGNFLLTNPIPPYGIKITTGQMAINKHHLHFNCPVYVVDYPILTAYFDYQVRLVDVPDSIPEGPTQPITASFTLTE